MNDIDKLKQMLLSEDVENFNLAVEILLTKFSKNELMWKLVTFFKSNLDKYFIRDVDGIPHRFVKGSQGLYAQLRNGHVHTFDNKKLTLGMLKEVFTDMFNKKKI